MVGAANIEICAPQKRETANLINLTGVSGILHGIGVAHAMNGKILLDIELDDDCSESDVVCSGSEFCENTGITFNLPFENKVRVDAQNKASSEYVRVWASFTINE